MKIIDHNSSIKNIYEHLSEQIINLYNNMSKSSSFKLDKNDVLTGFDAYVQSIIIKSLLHKRHFEPGELNFVKNIVKFSDYYKNINISKDAVPSKELEETLYKESKSVIKQVPAFIMMSALVDKELERSLIKSHQTFSMVLYSALKSIINIVLDDPEDDYSEKVLFAVGEFFKNNHILYYN